jgi:pSer/pThr/pTyr-binding forkhead associated (FHA) protein
VGKERGKHSVHVWHKGQEHVFEIEADEFVIGRGEDATVRLDTPEISRQHARVTFRGESILVRDLGSSNGTFVEGRRIARNEDGLLEGHEPEFTLGRGVRVKVKPAVHAEKKTSVLTSMIESERSRTEKNEEEASRHTRNSLNSILDMERKRLYEGVDSLKAELAELLSQKRQIEQQLERTKEEVEERVLELRVEKLDLEKEIKIAAEKVELEIDAMVSFRDKAAAEHQALVDKALSERAEQLAKLKREHRKTLERLEEDYRERRARLEADGAELARLTSGLDEKLSAVRAQIGEAERERDRRRAELSAENATLEESVARAREALAEVEKRRDALAEEIRDARLAADREKDLDHETAQKLREEIEALQKEADAKRDEADRIRSEIKDVDCSLEELREIFAKQKETFDQAGEDVKRAREEAEALRKQIQHDKEMQELESRRHSAELETTALELRSRKAAFENDIEACKLDQMKAKRDLQELLDKRAAEEKNLQAAAERTAELRAAISKLEEERATRKAEADTEAARAAESAESVARLRKEHDEVRESTAQARKALMAARSELDTLRAEGAVAVEAELKKLRDDNARIIFQSAEAERQRFDAEKARRFEELEKEFARKGTAMELDLATAKLNKLGELEKMGEEKAALDRYRREFMVKEIVRGAQELARGGSLVNRGNELRDFVLAVLEGRTASTTSAQAQTRTRNFWLKVAAGVAAPVAVVAILYAFPGLPGMVSGHLSRKIASEKSDNGAFFEEIRQKGAKYQPDTSREYRATYADNILFAEGYSDMKQSEEEKRKWILVLNDFIVGRLGLTDRVIPNFISAESIMVHDLLQVRENILPQFKEQSFARMAEIEKQHSEKLISLLDGAGNYQKFRALEKSYYADFLSRKPASVKKPAATGAD